MLLATRRPFGAAGVYGYDAKTNIRFFTKSDLQSAA
jgi:hypothetical protein